MAVGSQRRKSLQQRLWALLTSRQVAVILLLAALAVLVLSLLLPQVPNDLDEAGLQAWWSSARERYGENLDLYRRLGLLNLAGSPFFLVLSAALLVNTLACTVDRLGGLWRQMKRLPAIRLPEEAYAAADLRSEGVSPAQARRALHRFGSRLRQEAGAPHYFHATTWRLAPVGTVATHLGLFLFAVAALLHSRWAWRESLLLDLRQDSTSPATSRLERKQCSVRYHGYGVRQGAGRRPTVEGQLGVWEGGNFGLRWIGPATSLTACGTHFYLASQGLALYVTAFREGSSEGQSVAAEENGCDSSSEGQPAVLRFLPGDTTHSFRVASLDWRVNVAPAEATLAGSEEEPLYVRVERAGLVIFEGAVDNHRFLSLPGGQLWFHVDRYLQVDVVHDPGTWPFVAGGLLLALGGGLSLLLPARQLWARLGEEGRLEVCLGLAEEAREEEATRLERRIARSRGGGP